LSVAESEIWDGGIDPVSVFNPSKNTEVGSAFALGHDGCRRRVS
jgi:hypothetical protein